MRIIILGAAFLMLFTTSCKKNMSDYVDISSYKIVLNPYDIAPLSAIFEVKTKIPCSISIEVLGESPIEHHFEKKDTLHQLPILGLYADKNNQIALEYVFDSFKFLDTISIQTDSLPDIFPNISIEKMDVEKMEKGMSLCDFHYGYHGKFFTMPFIFDHQGKIRWFMDLCAFDDILWPIQQLSDGVILLAGRNSIFEYDFTGKLLKDTKIDKKYWIHHEVLELPNGHLLLAVSKSDLYIKLNEKLVPSAHDIIIEYDRETGKIIKEWDLAQVMDVTRHDLHHQIGGDGNWLHMNGLAYSAADSCIIVSGKHQGVAKITQNNELKWILTPQKNWGKAGRQSEKFDTKAFLLTALDANGQPFSDSIQLGEKSVADFDFPWGQHAPEFLPNGNLIIFDNGTFRNFIKNPNYTRAVEYKIDENKKTVQQIWQYGKERDHSFFSLIIGDVDYLPESQNILITSGHIEYDGEHYAKIVEVDYPTQEAVFEATILYKDSGGNGFFEWAQFDILYRSERFELYKN